MATESVLNLDELLAAIPGDDPAGEPVPFAVREDLEQLRKEIDPNDYEEDDPARPTEAKKADWPRIAKLGMSTLTDTSKDLLVAARTTEALANQHGFAGLADGLRLLRGLVEQCWDRLHPAVEDGDVEARGGPFTWLGEADRGARFPNEVRALPLVRGDMGVWSWRDWKSIRDGGREKADFDRAIAAADREDCQRTFDDLTRCLTEFKSLTTALTAKMGPDGPAMSELQSALSDCYTLGKQVLQQKGPAAADNAVAEGTPAEANGTPAGANRPTTSRAEAYRRLAEAADVIERLEPHSPIPYLVRRAVELGALPFPQLMRALIRDDGVISEMNRELGIKGPES